MTKYNEPSKLILPVIVISQFFCTSLWFAGNGVMHDLVVNFGLEDGALGHLTSAVQFGFIIGTLIFAIFTIADRFSPSRVFLFCALLGAVFNVGIIWEGNNLVTILIFRFLTGFFLAGIYPVGMKIASDYYENGLGKTLGFLVGALVVGTAFPHLLKQVTDIFSWEFVLILTSSLAVIGGLLMASMVPDGPFRKPSQQINLSAFFNVFQKRNFRSAAFGYFGHMWELYTFWAFVPVMLKTYSIAHPTITLDISLLSFLVIGIGGLACVLAGYLAQIFGVKSIASIALLLSCGCCIISPIMFSVESDIFFVSFLLFWGIVVIADSPLFSTLVAQNAPLELKGTALTIVSCVGFAITIVSIQLVSWVKNSIETDNVYVLLALGPILGLMALFANKKPTHNGD